jgi:hypothetical protein
MIDRTEKGGDADFNNMKDCIDQIEKQLVNLNKIGGEMPVIEKNVLAMMSFVHVLKFGISDLVELDKEG